MGYTKTQRSLEFNAKTLSDAEDEENKSTKTVNLGAKRMLSINFPLHYITLQNVAHFT